MSYTLTMTKAAEKDIESIGVYVFRKFGEQAAIDALNNIENKFIALAQFPNIGSQVTILEDLGIMNFGILILSPQNKALYKINHKKKTITVRIVCGCKESFENVLFRRLISYKNKIQSK